ncbi:MAG TPA: hypothetical protein VK900_22205 [Anaerolineales bacterium]|nr:hypothetical protein [Anaerolineales bacterium]
MTTYKRSKAWLLVTVLVALIIAAVIFFRSTQVAAPSVNGATDQPRPTPVQASTSAWNALLQATPFAYFTPLPEPASSVIDGTYAKVDQSWPQWWRCLRCADYRVTGGIWRLQFDRGVMRIFYEVNNWRSIASYAVEGDRLFIFNDPYCPENTGEYRWSIGENGLHFEVVNDPCAFELRAENLTKQSWLVCAAEEASTASTPGCDENLTESPEPVTPEPPLSVTVYGGDSRFFETPPEVIAHANSADMASPEGITVSFAEETIPYGLQRVLWWNGDWIEATVDDPYASMGVQFLGEGMIGWARVLFDGQEVWRGNTSVIWSKSGRHGGYIEVSGFSPGAHTLRVESMGFDYRPVTVASFGFSAGGGVRNEETKQ